MCVRWSRSSPAPCDKVPAAMGFILTAVFGFVVWIVLWAIDVKSFDAFMITALILVIGATLRILAPFLPGSRNR
jgi:uncharacterized membrane protein